MQRVNVLFLPKRESSIKLKHQCYKNILQTTHRKRLNKCIQYKNNYK